MNSSTDSAAAGGFGPMLTGGEKAEKPGPVSTTLLTLAAWLVLVLSVLAMECSLLMLVFGRQRLYEVRFMPLLMQQAPRVHALVLRHSETLAWVVFGMFGVTGLCALGTIRRGEWAYILAKKLLWVWAAIFALQTLAWLAGSMGVGGVRYAPGAAAGFFGMSAFVLTLGARALLGSDLVSLQFGIQEKEPEPAPVAMMLMPAQPPALPQAASMKRRGQGGA